MAGAMNETVMSESPELSVEDVLRDELEHGDIVLGTIGPVLGHLLANHDHSLFSDEIVTRVRGMVGNLASQMQQAQAELGEGGDVSSSGDADGEGLTAALLTESALVTHCHALAIEWQVTARLEGRNALDPVLSPLLQSLIASDDAPTAAAAMAALAAQARFAQRQRRMELPLGELPADVFHRCLALWSERSGGDVGAAEARLRETYDEGASRLGLLSRLVHGMGAGALAALSVSHAGAAIFLTALAAASHQRRDLMVIATNDRQLARFALSMRAAGLKPKAIEEQFVYFHPDVALPEGFETLRADRALSLLSASKRTSAE
jgi:hypothetical protein